MVDPKTLAALQRQIDRLEGPPVLVAGSTPALSCGYAEIDGCFPNEGLSPGAHQISCAADDPGAASAFACLLLARALRRRPSARVLVVQEISALKERGAAYGLGLHGLGVDPGRLVFVAAPNGAEALQAASDALALRAADVIMLSLQRDAELADLSVTRRFNLAAKRNGVSTLLATPDLSATSAALTRWRVASAPSFGPGQLLGAPVFDLDLTRNRHGPLGCWRVAWSSYDFCFQPVRDRTDPDRTNLAPPLVASVAA